MIGPLELEITKAAEDDIAAVLDFSAEQFGQDARRRYEVLIATALEDLRSDPRRPTSLDRPELRPGVRTYHLRHCHKRAGAVHGAVRSPRHILVFETPPGSVRVLRLLHDVMELDRHLPPQEGPQTGA